MGKPLNNLTDEHLTEQEKATLREWETRILTHLSVTPDAPSGVLALQPILVKRPQDISHYYNAINFLRDRGLVDHESLPPGSATGEVAAMQINEDGLAELARRQGRV